MTIQELQDYVNTKPDIRGLINVIVDYIQNNPGGGGGTQNLDQVLAQGSTLTEDRTIDLGGYTLILTDPDGLATLILSPANHQTSLETYHNTGDGNYTQITSKSENDNAEFQIKVKFNDGVKGVEISGNADATTATLTYTADTHTFNGVLNLPVQAAPASPNDGDIWRENNTNSGLKVRINGVTKTITVS